MAQTTWLKLRWHQKGITCRINLMGNVLGIINLCRHSIWILPSKVAEHIFILCITCAQNHQLNIISTDFIHHVLNEIKPLLACQSRHNAQHKLSFILVKAQFLLQSQFVLYFLFSKIDNAVIMINQAICCWIKHLIIYTIDNASKIMISRSHQSIQSLTIKWHLDFLGIGRTHRCHCICKDNSSL